MVTKIKDEELGVLGRRGKTKDYIEKQRVNIDYLRNHYEDLMKRYPNHWLMIRNGRVMGAEHNPDRFVDRLAKTRTSNNFLYYLASPRKRMLL